MCICVISSVNTKSSILSDLWVGYVTCCSKPIASIVSIKIEASVSFSSFTCRLKSPAIILLLCFVRTGGNHSVILSRNVVLVIGCHVEYGGLYITTTVIM